LSARGVALLQHHQRVDEFADEGFGAVTLPGQGRQNAQDIGAAGSAAEIAFDAQNGDDDFARNAMAVARATQGSGEFGGDGAAARDAAIRHGAAQIGRDRDGEFRLRLGFGEHGGLRGEIGGRRLEGLPGDPSGLRRRPYSLNKFRKIRSFRVLCGKDGGAGDEGEAAQQKAAVRMDAA